jgi:hypothetical protein
MKKVRIIAGAYGYKPDKDAKKKMRKTVAITRGETVDVTDSEAKRLVELKVAEYVTEDKQEAPKDQGGDAPDLDTSGDVM